MAGKVNKKEAKEAKHAAREKFKKDLSLLIEEILFKKNWTIQRLTNHLNENIPGLDKNKVAVEKWAQAKSAPIHKWAEKVWVTLKELQKETLSTEIPANYKKDRRRDKVKLRDFIMFTPEDLYDFWDEPYNNTFKLYNWPYTFSLIKPASILEESITLNNNYPTERGMYFKAHKLLPFAKENEGDTLAYAFDSTGYNLGVYLWNSFGHFEYPLFIANSLTELIAKNIITFEGQDILHFNSEEYLNETFEKYMEGFILPLNFKSYFDDSNEIHTHFKKLVKFYEKAFKECNRGIIKFEASGEFINISIERENVKRIFYNINEKDIYAFIERVNDELNSFDVSGYCRPDYFGYYIIDKKYVACLRLDIATDLIQKGYINCRYKMLPMQVFYNPEIVKSLFSGSPLQTDLDKEKNQRITKIE